MTKSKSTIAFCWAIGLCAVLVVADEVYQKPADFVTFLSPDDQMPMGRRQANGAIPLFKQLRTIQIATQKQGQLFPRFGGGLSQGY